MDDQACCSAATGKKPRRAYSGKKTCKAPGHEIREARKALPPQLRLQVWEKYMGPMIHGLCFVCEHTPITFGVNVEYGHVLAVANGGADTVENLRPICGSCNKSMGTQNLLEYRERLVQSGACEPIDISGITAGEILCESFGASSSNASQASPAEKQILDNLQVLTDARITLLASLLGIKSRSPRATRIAIARKQYTLPRQFHTGCTRISRDDIRELIADFDHTLLASIFGSPGPDATIAQLRVHAFTMLGIL